VIQADALDGKTLTGSVVRISARMGRKSISSADADSETPGRLPIEPMYYIGLDVHKRKISYCVKDSSGKVYAEGSDLL
jgi:hypothetical protein